MASLQILACTISEAASEIEKLLEKKSLPRPGFGEENATDYEGIDYELRSARNTLINAAQDTLRLAQGPEDQILGLAWSVSI